MPLYKILLGNLCTSSPEEFSWQDLCKRPLGKIFATDPHAMSRYKISKRGVLARSLHKISVRGLLARLLMRSLYKRSPQKTCEGPQRKISVRTIYRGSPRKTSAPSTRSGYKISLRGLLARSRDKISIRGLLARSLDNLPLGKMSV